MGWEEMPGCPGVSVYSTRTDWCTAWTRISLSHSQHKYETEPSNCNKRRHNPDFTQHYNGLISTNKVYKIFEGRLFVFIARPSGKQYETDYEFIDIDNDIIFHDKRLSWLLKASQILTPACLAAALLHVLFLEDTVLFQHADEVTEGWRTFKMVQPFNECITKA